MSCTCRHRLAGFRRREPAVSDHQLRPVPACLVGQVPTGCAQGGIGQSAPSGAGTRQPFLPQHPRGVQTFNNDPAVGFSQPCRQDVQVMSADIGDPAMQPGNLGGAVTVAPRAFCAARPCPAGVLKPFAAHASQRPWVLARVQSLSPSSVGDRGQPAHPDIDTNPRIRQRHLGLLGALHEYPHARVDDGFRCGAPRSRAPAPARHGCSRSMRRVFSWVRTVPITGSVRCRRSGSTRIAPVVKHTRSAVAAFLLKPRESDPFPGALARARGLPIPVRVYRAR